MGLLKKKRKKIKYRQRKFRGGFHARIACEGKFTTTTHRTIEAYLYKAGTGQDPRGTFCHQHPVRFPNGASRALSSRLVCLQRHSRHHHCAGRFVDSFQNSALYGTKKRNANISEESFLRIRTGFKYTFSGTCTDREY